MQRAKLRILVWMQHPILTVMNPLHVIFCFVCNFFLFLLPPRQEIWLFHCLRSVCSPPAPSSAAAWEDTLSSKWQVPLGGLQWGFFSSDGSSEGLLELSAESPEWCQHFRGVECSDEEKSFNIEHPLWAWQSWRENTGAGAASEPAWP